MFLTPQQETELFFQAMQEKDRSTRWIKLGELLSGIGSPKLVDRIVTERQKIIDGRVFGFFLSGLQPESASVTDITVKHVERN